MSRPRIRKRLGDLLVDQGVITAPQLQTLLSDRAEIDGRLERVGEADGHPAVRGGARARDGGWAKFINDGYLCNARL